MVRSRWLGASVSTYCKIVVLLCVRKRSVVSAELTGVKSKAGDAWISVASAGELMNCPFLGIRKMSMPVGASPANSFVRAVHGEIAEYMRRLEIARALFAFLLVYTFLEKALDEPQKRTKLSGVHVGDRRDNLEVGYVGVLASHAEALFAGRTFHGV